MNKSRKGENVLQSLANKILQLENMSDIETDITVNENEFEMQINEDNYAENIENMDRFGGNNKFETPAAFIDEMKNPNTKKKTALDIKLLHKFAEKRHLNLDSIDNFSLDNLLSSFFLSVRKANNENYEPDSLLCFFASMTRYFKEKKEINLKTSPDFRQTRETLAARRKQLKSLGLGNRQKRADAFTQGEMEQLWKAGELGDGM